MCDSTLDAWVRFAVVSISTTTPLALDPIQGRRATTTRIDAIFVRNGIRLRTWEPTFLCAFALQFPLFPGCETDRVSTPIVRRRGSLVPWEVEPSLRASNQSQGGS